MKYDSTFDTQSHIVQVRHLLFYIIQNLMARLDEHDRSKLEAPEKEMFDEFTPKLRALTYGSPEYKQALIDMGPALENHYAANSHHPEHFEPATDDEIGEAESLEINQSRFKISGQLQSILINTAQELGWL